MAERDPFVGGLKGNLTLFDSLLHIPIIGMENVLLDQLERAGTLQQLVAQAVGQLGSFQLSLLLAQRRIDARTNVFKNVSVNEFLSVRPSSNFRSEHVVHLGALQSLLLLVQRRTCLGRRHDALFNQGCHRPANHQFDFKS